MPSPAPCQASRNACHRPDASVDTGRSSPPATPAFVGESAPARMVSRQAAVVATSTARTARNPGCETMRRGSDAGRWSSDSESSATGPVSVVRAASRRRRLRSGVMASWMWSMVVRAATAGATKSVPRWSRRNRLVRRPRQRAPRVANGWSSALTSVSSRQACLGRLATRSVTDDTRADSAIQTARNGTASGEQRASVTCRAARRPRRSSSRGLGTPGRSPSMPADASRTTAPGTTTTRWPASWARQPKSRSAPCSTNAGSKPPRSS